MNPLPRGKNTVKRNSEGQILRKSSENLRLFTGADFVVRPASVQVLTVPIPGFDWTCVLTTRIHPERLRPSRVYHVFTGGVHIVSSEYLHPARDRAARRVHELGVEEDFQKDFVLTVLFREQLAILDFLKLPVPCHANGLKGLPLSWYES